MEQTYNITVRTDQQEIPFVFNLFFKAALDTSIKMAFQFPEHRFYVRKPTIISPRVKAIIE